jgi:hypothetical protein
VNYYQLGRIGKVFFTEIFILELLFFDQATKKKGVKKFAHVAQNFLILLTATIN